MGDMVFSRNVITKKWEYWDSYWSYVEWFIILVSISAIGFYFYKETVLEYVFLAVFLFTNLMNC